MPPQGRNISSETDTELLNLYALFETEDEDMEFFGCDPSLNVIQNSHQELTELFLATSVEEDFSGFYNTSRNSELITIFAEDSHDEEFLGF